MKTILVVGAAPADDPRGVYRKLLTSAHAVVAADAAGEWCVGLGRVPDLVVGDFDSARPGAVDRLRDLGVQVIVHPADKDFSDLDLAAMAALERFGGPLTLTAAFSGRFDHTLSSFGTLLRSGAAARAIEPGWSAWAVLPGTPAVIASRPEQPFGVISPAGAGGVVVHGGRWELAGVTLEPLESRAISNEATGSLVTVSCATGSAVALVTAV
jgi:thiamine pyrophosphokinase